MSRRPAEVDQFHCRLMKCGLEIEHSRAYWQRVGDNPNSTWPSSSRLPFTLGGAGNASIAAVIFAGSSAEN